jgi:general secretion pathway protein I
MNIPHIMDFGCHWLRQCFVASCTAVHPGKYRYRALAKPVAPDQSPANLGFTLLEIILSLAILAGALAALGEVMRSADQSATTAEDETQAQILAASVMDELVAGSRELTAANQVPFDTNQNPSWVYSIALEQTAYDELIAARVRVELQANAQLQPANFELVRWLPNPNYQSTSTDQQSSSSTSSTSSGSSSSSTGSSSSGSGGQP